jgi:hypothetical protein
MANPIEVKKEQIRFRDLSVWLKIAVIGSWIYLGLFLIGFIYGFLSTLSSYI